MRIAGLLVFSTLRKYGCGHKHVVVGNASGGVFEQKGYN